MTTAVSQRTEALDVLRGAALLWMAIYHFAFDLSHFGLWPQDFRADPLWTWQRTAILSLFLFCAGFAQALARAQRQHPARFWRRWAQIAACALLVTAGSWWMFPRSAIYFGVLHGLAVMLPLLRASAGCRVGLLCSLGLAAVLGRYAVVPALEAQGWLAIFQSGWLQWLGLVRHPPVTEDYVPLLPWLGAAWWGAACGRWVLQGHAHWLCWLPATSTARGLAMLGRWSLSFYMLHQPLLIGALMLASAAAGVR